jgi:HTTM domain
MTADASSREPSSGSWHARLRRVFGLDVRALAVLRISLALLLLASLSDRLRNFSAFYTDAGVLPAAEARNGARFEPWDGVSWLHPFAWLPDPWGSVALFAAATVAAMFLLVGRQTRIAGFLAWIMLTAIDNRNPLVIDGGDDLLRLLLFWGLFLPLSARWSMDAAPSRPLASNRVVSMGTVALLVQLASIYSMSALFKSYHDWVADGDALHYALHLEQFATPVGVALRDHLPTRLLSPGIWWVELTGPLLLFSPFATDRLRYVLFLAFATMHAGIELTMGIGLFSYVCVAAWLATLPAGFWERLERVIPAAEMAAHSASPRESRSPGTGRTSNLLAGFFLGYVLLWNSWSLKPGVHDAWFPFGARWLGYQLRLAQLWGMFSPSPSKSSSWLELKAQTRDGAVFCLRPDGRVCPRWPARPQALLSERWRKFHERVVQNRGSGLDERYARFLLKRFERSAPRAAARVTIVWIRKPSTPPIPSNGGSQREEAKLLATAGMDLDDARPIPRTNRMGNARIDRSGTRRSR